MIRSVCPPALSTNFLGQDFCMELSLEDYIQLVPCFWVEVGLHHVITHMVSMHVGSREGKGAVQKMVPGSAVGSISETVKMRSSIPCLIIRPSVRLLMHQNAHSM